MSTVISIRGLEKRFGRTVALDGLDLEVAQGEIHGFLGPNGAGKSTTIRILLGLARASGGEARLFDRDPWRDAADLHRRVAYVPGDVSLWPNLSGGEAIDLLSRLRGGTADRAAYAERKARLIEAFQLDPRKKGRAYSKGNRQKVALVAAFATPAELYILDEPTSGLDPLMEQVFNREIDRAAADGATVLLSSHILSEVETLCDRVSIIRAGRRVEAGTLAELRHLTRSSVAFVHVPGQESAVEALDGAHDVVVNAGRVQFTADSDRVAALLPELGRLGVEGLTVAPPSLEELFLRHYGDDPAMADGAPAASGAGAEAAR
ncbi:ABC transporter ATP-binding protein [Agromyces luteolus]|uniref:ATP-binding cassette domain-containing protein n=1 Tax=Agromyces luteolus TaxID=88373 RepID=A0A7C9HHV1_9MICO|nr:ABC transporter ATP-binding protein [Agromyces luteolus]MUN05544.1 ATP-binding cassette domain-containing protein [Agromyces luteolus]GLK26084.1 ABC transporter ATP-binding protein [Agromyces luteolus]